MHPFFCPVVRAFTKFGIAIAASKPVIVTKKKARPEPGGKGRYGVKLSLSHLTARGR